MTSIGFTGTRHGMTAAQRRAVASIIDEAGVVTAHHGDCVGADADFHELVRRDSSGNRIVGHLPVNESDRAFCQFDEVREPLPYMRRNAEIVKAADVMIATPYEAEQQPRGGTWRTVEMARKAKKPLALVLPDGMVRFERWESIAEAWNTARVARGGEGER